jgi:hypothetical protein
LRSIVPDDKRRLASGGKLIRIEIAARKGAARLGIDADVPGGKPGGVERPALRARQAGVERNPEGGECPAGALRLPLTLAGQATRVVVLAGLRIAVS